MVILLKHEETSLKNNSNSKYVILWIFNLEIKITFKRKFCSILLN